MINRQNGAKGGRPKKNNPVGLISLTETKAKEKALRIEEIEYRESWLED